MNQRGLIRLSLMGWLAVGAAAIILGMSIALKVQTSRLDAVKQEYAGFQAQIKAAGDAAKAKADAENRLNQERKEKADREYKKLLAANTVLNQRLRDNAGGSSLPSGETVAGSADKICFGRPELDAALRRFTSGAAELAIEGQSAIDELNIAKKWAADR